MLLFFLYNNTMYIEALIDRIANNGRHIFDLPLSIFKADATISYSLSDQIQRGNGFTEKQRALAIRLVTKYADILSTDLKYDVHIDIQNPQFMYPIRKLSESKTVRIKDIANIGKRILVQFPYSESLVEVFKRYKKINTLVDDVAWDSEERAWVFGFNESNVVFLIKTLTDEFTFDSELLEIANEIKLIEEQLDAYVPMVVFDDGKFFYKNTVDKIPQPSSNNLISVLLDARRYGVQCWDESIDLALRSDEINPVSRSFINNTNGSPLIVKDRDLSAIDELISFSKNVLFVIPGGSELEHLHTVTNFLKSKNITEEQISIMFRLDSSSGKICNEFIKDNKLNSPLSEETRFICVSGKIPKPLIESNKKFDLVVHFGTNSAHYTLRNYIKNHHNVISMTLDNKNQELKLAQL